MREHGVEKHSWRQQMVIDYLKAPVIEYSAYSTRTEQMMVIVWVCKYSRLDQAKFASANAASVE